MFLGSGISVLSLVGSCSLMCSDDVQSSRPSSHYWVIVFHAIHVFWIHLSIHTPPFSMVVAQAQTQGNYHYCTYPKNICTLYTQSVRSLGALAFDFSCSVLVPFYVLLFVRWLVPRFRDWTFPHSSLTGVTREHLRFTEIVFPPFLVLQRFLAQLGHGTH